MFCPGGGVGVFEIGHEDAGAGVEGVDDHLAVGRAGDLDAAIEQVGRGGRDFPGRISDFGGLRDEIGIGARIDAALAGAAGFQQLAAARFEAPGQVRQEGQGLGRENAGLRRTHGRNNLRRFTFGGYHTDSFC